MATVLICVLLSDTVIYCLQADVSGVKQPIDNNTDPKHTDQLAFEFKIVYKIGYISSILTA